MKKTSSENVRFCDVCKKDVHFCSNKNELDSHRKSGDCIATYDFYIDSIKGNDNSTVETDDKKMPHSRTFVVGRINEMMSDIRKGRLKP